MQYTHLTDAELVRRLNATPGLSILEVELLSRVERLLDEVDAMEKDVPPCGPCGEELWG